jgi:hypothetical protein
MMLTRRFPSRGMILAVLQLMMPLRSPVEGTSEVDARLWMAAS